MTQGAQFAAVASAFSAGTGANTSFVGSFSFAGAATGGAVVAAGAAVVGAAVTGARVFAVAVCHVFFAPLCVQIRLPDV